MDNATNYTVYGYELTHGLNSIKLPTNSKFLSCQKIKEVIRIFFMVSTKETETEVRYFECIHTAEAMEGNFNRVYLGTFSYKKSGEILHIFERT